MSHVQNENVPIRGKHFCFVVDRYQRDTTKKIKKITTKTNKLYFPPTQNPIFDGETQEQKINGIFGILQAHNN